MAESETMLSTYDHDMLDDVARSYYDDSGFYNYGYWQPGTRTQRQASENLIEKLLGLLPMRAGRVLDAACGVGGSTRYLTKYFEARDISAINLSNAQARQAHRNAPECGVAVMDAARLGFAEGTFDSVICVESAFHFDTREAFFKEAHRVLKPGGALVMTDIIYRRMRALMAERAHLPEANRLEGPEHYRLLLASAGFRDVRVIDATARCSGTFARNLFVWPFRSLVADPAGYRAFLPRLKVALRQGTFALFAKHYLIVSAIRE